MSSELQYQITLIVGNRNTGKTTLAKALARTRSKRIMVIDTFEHEAYDDFKTIAFEKLHLIDNKPAGQWRCFDTDALLIMEKLNEKKRFMTVILEDAAKYLEANLSKTAKAFFIDSKQNKINIIAMFHFIGDIPPYLAKHYNNLILFKTDEGLKKNKEDVFVQWDKIKALHEKVMKHPNPYHSEVLSK